MSRASVLATSPEELRTAARLLRGVGAQIEGLVGRTAAASSPAQGWAGLAALEHQARAGALRQLTALTAVPGQEVARALDRCADVAEAAGVRVRTWTRRVEEGLAELTAMRALGPPPDPLLEQAWRRRLAEVQDQVARARRLIEQAEGEFDAAQEQTSRVLADAWSVVEEVGRLGTWAKDVRAAARRIPWAVVHTVRTTDMVIALVRARWATEAAARARALRRGTALLNALVQQLRRPAEAAKTLRFARFAPGPVGMLMSWLVAWSDLRTGGGYQGWRGDITRVLAVGALVGAPVVVAGLVIPPAAVGVPIGVGLIGIYQAWSLGNAVYDGLPVAARYARLVVRHAPLVRDAVVDLAGRARERAIERLADLRTVVLGEPPGRVVGLPGGAVEGPRVKEILDEVVDRLPDAGPLRDRLREVGVPVRLPGIPLGPVLRAPVDLGLPRWTGTTP